MKFNKYVIMALALLTAVPNASQANVVDRLTDDVLGNLYTMKNVYSAVYAPAAWKKTFAGYDLDLEFNKAVAAIQANPNMNLQQSRVILQNFIYAMKDYHTSISFVSTEEARLPFMVKSVGDRYFIVYIDRTKLPETTFPFNVGDELVTFDSRPTGDVVAELQAVWIENVPATDKAMAERNLVYRRASRGLPVPQGPVTVGIKAKDSNQVLTQQLIWDYTPEKIFPRGDLTGDLQTFLADTGNALEKNPIVFRPHMEVKIMNDKIDAKSDTPYDIGARKTFTPDLGTKIWESSDDSIFYAYIYMTSDRKIIGYLRLASYIATDYVKAVTEFSTVIDRFQKTTDAMIIDQVNNPGGSVFYLYALASMLSDKPLVTPLHRMAITQADVLSAVNIIKLLENIKTDEEARKVIPASDLDGYPPSYEFVRFELAYANFIISEWNAGRKLTHPYWIAGVDHINPATTHYTKPILLLVNQLDFSGGDFFPSILQDNKRVKILGSRTAGAGGYVNDVTVPNNIGVDEFRVTGSIAERVNGNPIENLGVTPDIVYEMSVDDYTKNYAAYIAAIKSAISGLLQ